MKIVKVERETDTRVDEYPNARSWYFGEDKSLQIYKSYNSDGGPGDTVAEYPEGRWSRVWIEEEEGENV